MPTTALLDLPSTRVFLSRGGPEGAPKVVLLHGYLVSGHYFRAIRPRLEERFDVLAIDLPGHGESDRPAPRAYRYDFPTLAATIVEALDALGVDRANVWGHSTGGGVALAMAANHPARVERLVLEDSAGYPLPLPLLAKVALLPVVGELLFKHTYSRRDLRSFERGVHKDPSICTEEDVDFYWERFNRPGGRDSMYAYLKLLAASPEENQFAKQVQAETLVVWGEEDRTIPLAHGRKLAEVMPRARLEVVPACGHSPHEERPKALLDVVLPFLLGEAGAAAPSTQAAGAAE